MANNLLIEMSLLEAKMALTAISNYRRVEKLVGTSPSLQKEINALAQKWVDANEEVVRLARKS